MDLRAPDWLLSQHCSASVIATACTEPKTAAEPPKEPPGKCEVVGHGRDPAALGPLGGQHGVPLVLVGDDLLACSCAPPSRLGGDTEGRKLGGDTEGRKLSGDTEGRKLGGDTEGRKLGGDVEGRKLGGDVEGRRLGGDTEGRASSAATSKGASSAATRRGGAWEVTSKRSRASGAPTARASRSPRSRPSRSGMATPCATRTAGASATELEAIARRGGHDMETKWVRRTLVALALAGAYAPAVGYAQKLPPPAAPPARPAASAPPAAMPAPPPAAMPAVPSSPNVPSAAPSPPAPAMPPVDSAATPPAASPPVASPWPPPPAYQPGSPLPPPSMEIIRPADNLVRVRRKSPAGFIAGWAGLGVGVSMMSIGGLVLANQISGPGDHLTAAPFVAMAVGFTSLLVGIALLASENPMVVVETPTHAKKAAPPPGTWVF